jgi:peptidoglycan/LPS O-acetylase OafA/YrhL
MSNATIIPVSPRGKSLLSAILLLAITNYFPNAHQTWFVEESGNIHIAPVIGLIIGIGLFMQKQWARKAGLIAGFFIAIIALFMMTSLPAKPGFALMLLCGGLLIYLLRPNQS